jgi:hypothetical protein
LGLCPWCTGLLKTVIQHQKFDSSLKLQNQYKRSKQAHSKKSYNYGEKFIQSSTKGSCSRGKRLGISVAGLGLCAIICIPLQQMETLSFVRQYVAKLQNAYPRMKSRETSRVTFCKATPEICCCHLVYPSDVYRLVGEMIKWRERSVVWE